MEPRRSFTVRTETEVYRLISQEEMKSLVRSRIQKAKELATRQARAAYPDPPTPHEQLGQDAPSSSKNHHPGWLSVDNDEESCCSVEEESVPLSDNLPQGKKVDSLTEYADPEIILMLTESASESGSDCGDNIENGSDTIVEQRHPLVSPRHGSRPRPETPVCHTRVLADQTIEGQTNHPPPLPSAGATTSTSASHSLPPKSPLSIPKLSVSVSPMTSPTTSSSKGDLRRKSPQHEIRQQRQAQVQSLLRASIQRVRDENRSEAQNERDMEAVVKETVRKAREAAQEEISEMLKDSVQRARVSAEQEILHLVQHSMSQVKNRVSSISDFPREDEAKGKESVHQNFVCTSPFAGTQQAPLLISESLEEAFKDKQPSPWAKELANESEKCANEGHVASSSFAIDDGIIADEPSDSELKTPAEENVVAIERFPIEKQEKEPDAPANATWKADWTNVKPDLTNSHQDKKVVQPHAQEINSHVDAHRINPFVKDVASSRESPQPQVDVNVVISTSTEGTGTAFQETRRRIEAQIGILRRNKRMVLENSEKIIELELCNTMESDVPFDEPGHYHPLTTETTTPVTEPIQNGTQTTLAKPSEELLALEDEVETTPTNIQNSPLEGQFQEIIMQDETPIEAIVGHPVSSPTGASLQNVVSDAVDGDQTRSKVVFRDTSSIIPDEQGIKRYEKLRDVRDRKTHADDGKESTQLDFDSNEFGSLAADTIAASLEATQMRMQMLKEDKCVALSHTTVEKESARTIQREKLKLNLTKSSTVQVEVESRDDVVSPLSESTVLSFEERTDKAPRQIFTSSILETTSDVQLPLPSAVQRYEASGGGIFCSNIFDVMGAESYESQTTASLRTQSINTFDASMEEENGSFITSAVDEWMGTVADRLEGNHLPSRKRLTHSHQEKARRERISQDFREANQSGIRKWFSSVEATFDLAVEGLSSALLDDDDDDSDDDSDYPEVEAPRLRRYSEMCQTSFSFSDGDDHENVLRTSSRRKQRSHARELKRHSMKSRLRSRIV